MTKVTFIKAQMIKKKETGEPFYFVQIMIGEEVAKVFVSEEVYKQIQALKPQTKKEYNAEFEINIRYEKLNVTLKGMTEIK